MDICSVFWLVCKLHQARPCIPLLQHPQYWKQHEKHIVGRQHIYVDWWNSPKLDLSSQPRECARCLEGSFSSSKDANCCHYAFSLVLDFSPKNLYGHMPSHSGIGYCYPGANGTSPSLQKRLFWHSICLHVVPTNYSKSLLWLGIRRNDIWGFRFKFICKVKREHLNLFAFSTKILGYVVI